MASEQERDTRDEQQRQHNFPERCFVNPSKQLKTKPSSREEARKPHHKEFSGVGSDGSLHAEPERAHQEDRDRHGLKDRALDVLWPATQVAPAGDENSGKAGEATKYAVEKSHRRIARPAATGELQRRPEERVGAIED